MNMNVINNNVEPAIIKEISDVILVILIHNGGFCIEIESTEPCHTKKAIEVKAIINILKINIITDTVNSFLFFILILLFLYRFLFL
jgi:hypothetical protein